ncbi:MAG: ribonuclease HII [Maricaulaceae bacterium]
MTEKRTLTTPDFSYEHKFMTSHMGPVCGVDEAGRGPLAGPVVAAAVILDKARIPSGLNDSKKLSLGRREALFDEIWDTCHVGVGISEPEEIDRINILGASLIAMRRAVLNLPLAPAYALIDGNRSPDLPCAHETIIKGDAKSLSIAASSIIAKVTRDRLMKEAGQRFPAYGLEQHKGYPTAAHRASAISVGPSAIHRVSFAPFKGMRIK